jgi:hypothetical protein
MLVAFLAATVVAAEPKKQIELGKYPKLVTPEIEQQIENTLAWLADQQDLDGKWEVANPGAGFAAGRWTTVSTSAIALAFLAHGDTPTSGHYSKNVMLALLWILRNADEKTGQITTKEDEQRPMYGHCHAILLLSELYGMEGDTRLADRIRPVIERGILVIQQAQTSRGGWYYGFKIEKTTVTPMGDNPEDNNPMRPDGDGVPVPGQPVEVEQDEGSVTVHAIQALRAAKNAGFLVDKRVIDKGLEYIVKCQNQDGGIKYQFGESTKSEPAISAAAVATFYMAGVYQLDEKEYAKSSDAKAKAVKRCWEYAQREYSGDIIFSAIDAYPFYAHLYMAEASWISGGKHWAEYYPKISKWLLTDTKYRRGKLPIWTGCQSSDNFYYNTAAALLILQMPYQRLPIFQK